MKRSSTSHERLTGGEAPPRSSDRSFGVLFAVVFAIAGAWPLTRGAPVRGWWLLAASAVLALAMLRPHSLGHANRWWRRLGLLLHALVTPLVMFLVFYATVTPTAVLLRLFGKDPLRRRLDRGASTYWIERQPPGPAPETMTRQF